MLKNVCYNRDIVESLKKLFMLENNLELLTIDLKVDKIHNKNVIINFV